MAQWVVALVPKPLTHLSSPEHTRWKERTSSSMLSKLPRFDTQALAHVLANEHTNTSIIKFPLN